MSDNAFAYTKGPQFAGVLAQLGARHIRIPPYTPRWNGKLERFFGRLEDEWGHAREWPNSGTVLGWGHCLLPAPLWLGLHRLLPS